MKEEWKTRIKEAIRENKEYLLLETYGGECFINESYHAYIKDGLVEIGQRLGTLPQESIIEVIKMEDL